MIKREIRRKIGMILAAACCVMLPACDKPAPNQELNQTNQTGKKSQPPKPQRFWASLDGIDAENIIGWAWDSSTPDVRVSVEIYDGTTLLTTVQADMFRSDLASITDGKHSFSVPIPASLKDGKPHQIHAKIVGTDFTFPPAPLPFTSPPSTAK